MKAVAHKSAAGAPQHDDGNDRGGPMAVALNGRAVVQAQMAFGAMLNERAPLQRMMQDDDEDEEVDAHPLIGAIGRQAEGHGLTSDKGGEFISAEEVGDPDFRRNQAHLHLFRTESQVNDDDTALLAGHAVWAKRGQSLQNRQRFEIQAVKKGGRWDVGAPDWTEFQKQIEPDPNPAAKQKLFDIVESQLGEVLKDALNAEFT